MAVLNTNRETTMPEQSAIRSLHTGGVTGSIPVAPTIQTLTNTEFDPRSEGVFAGSSEPSEDRTRFFRRLYRLFNRSQSGWGRREDNLHRQACEWLYLCWWSGNLRLRLHTLPGDDWADGLHAARQSARERESVEHILGKVFAADWLRSMGSPDPLEEQWCCVGRADVFCPELNIVVEVGQTPPGKLYRAALEPIPPRFVLVPFRWRDVKPKGVEFILNANTQFIANAVEEARLERISAVVDRMS